MKTLIEQIDPHTITALLIRHGAWLLQQQPACAPRDLTAMQDTFERCSGTVLQQLEMALSSHWPEIPFSHAEFDPEQQIKPEHPAYWICDPIDGAVQFLSGLPLWTLTLCLVIDAKPVMAFVYDPVGNAMYHAQTGKGAFCNGRRMQVGQRDQLSLAVLGTSFPNYPQRPQAEIDEFLHLLAKVIPQVFAQRWMGPSSLSLAQLAEGKLDGYWETGRSLYDWLPGVLIAQEAGAFCTDLKGGVLDWNSDGILFASPAMYPLLSTILLT
ncbi:inositol monophosphatase family protein [Undibacterium sp. Dicai25W]|uniref:inositol monophosphatase family protein n=1 Tax=Undibacterium sp. Dicai25W TaxID=3413034 RepID=UPI003BF1A5FA